MTITAKKIDHFTGHKDSVYAICKSNVPRKFYSAAGDGLVVEWNLDVPDLGKSVVRVQNSVYSMYLDEVQNELWIAENYEGLHCLNTGNWKEIASIGFNKVAIFCMESFGNKLFVGSGDGVISVIDKEEKSFLKHIKASDKNVRCLSICPEGKNLLAGYSDNHIRVFSLDSYKMIHAFEAHSNSIFQIVFAEENKYLYSVSRDARVKVWSPLENYVLLNEAVGHMYAINDIAFSPNQEFFATCSMDKSIKIWQTEGFKLRKVLDNSRYPSHGTSINRLLWMSNTELLACSDDRTISFWKIEAI